MNQKYLIRAIMQDIEQDSSIVMDKKAVELVIKSLPRVIAFALESGDNVNIRDFGVFSVQHKKERTGRNPQTGETMTIKACKKPVFKASGTLKDVINT